MTVNPDTLRLETERLVLVMPGPRAAARVLAYHDDNRAHLGPWEPPLADGYFTLEWHDKKLARDREDLAEDRALRLYVFARDTGPDGEVLGLVNFSQIVRGPLHSCMMGYSLAAKVNGRGLITEALRAAISFVFAELKLHRIEASYVPANERSGRVLRRLGFAVEGYSRDYLFTGGAWRDHIGTALLNAAFVPLWPTTTSSP